MSAKDRISAAISDLEGFLIEGTSVEEALLKAAGFHDVKPDVLRHRALQALGELDQVKAKSDREAARIKQEWLAKTAIREFSEMENIYADFSKYFEARVGRPPTEVEIRDMKKLTEDAILTKLFNEAGF